MTEAEARAIAEQPAPSREAVDQALAGWLLGWPTDPDEGLCVVIHERHVGWYDRWWSAHGEIALQLLDDLTRDGTVGVDLRRRLLPEDDRTWHCALTDLQGRTGTADGPTRAAAIALAVLRYATLARGDVRSLLGTAGDQHPGEPDAPGP